MASWRVTAANGAGLRCASSVSSAIMCRAYRGEVLRARDAVAGDAGWACVVKPGYGLLWALRRDLERTDAPPSPAPAEPPAPPAPPTPRRGARRGAPPAPPLPLLDAPGTASCARSAPRRPRSGPRARRGGRAAGFGGAWVVHVISDLHTDMAENRDWLARHPSPRTADGAKHCVFTKVRRDVGCCPASPQELGFDAGCAWPAHVQAADARGSFGGGVADAMLRLNERRVAAAPENGAVVTCATLPRRELYVGWRASASAWATRLDAQLRKARCAVHCCGHAHTDFDATHGGVRYVQRALGYPHERYGAFRGPLALEFPP
ncbi:calcineurin-like phosphoesterase [Aureococcus anophagefferens]|nr:calcineurin-like phosphoesterase [Aureococcus anophagefferens]